MVLFTMFIVGAAWIFGEASGYGLSFVGWALVISGIMSWGSYYYSDKIILTLSRARPANRKRDFQFYTVTENLAMAAHLPKPRLYVIDDTAPNAFATGRDPKHAVVAVTEGLLERLDRTELEGVLAHELGHIGNRDMLLSTAVVVLVGFISILADMFMRSAMWGGMSDSDNNRTGGVILLIAIALSILAPIAATLIQLAISRRREFLADSSGALLTRYPEGLASALKKISATSVPMRSANNATAHLFIANPFGAQSTSGFHKLFMTHPPVEERVRALIGVSH